MPTISQHYCFSPRKSLNAVRLRMKSARGMMNAMRRRPYQKLRSKSSTETDSNAYHTGGRARAHTHAHTPDKQACDIQRSYDERNGNDWAKRDRENMEVWHRRRRRLRMVPSTPHEDNRSMQHAGGLPRRTRSTTLITSETATLPISH